MHMVLWYITCRGYIVKTMGIKLVREITTNAEVSLPHVSNLAMKTELVTTILNIDHKLANLYLNVITEWM
jgi:hypothetical protein